MVISRDQVAGRSYSTNTDNKSSEGVEHFKCLGTTLANKNSSHEAVMRRLSGNACYHLVQNLFVPICYPKI
jgi:hypothetical protein